ncbi:MULTISPECIES: RDD family protein [unclassified Agrococcus]|uniref:RDD family protein n=1 Tax=unclassified Agrococcus TaxID=2615065 RepID=UPI00361CA514
MSAQSREPGWYQDPFGTSPEDRRYWDGETWLATQQVQPAQAEAPGAPVQQQPEPFSGQPYGGQPYGGQPHEQRGGWGERPAVGGWGQPASDDDRIRTPDGVELASWGRRFAAYAIDWAVLGVVSLVLGAVLGIWGAFVELFEASAGASEAEVMDAFQGFVAANTGALLAFSMLQLAASGLYHVGLTATRGRTIGKRAVGIRVRLREREGLPIWRAAALRWLAHFALPNLLSGVPGLGFVAGIFPVVDGLWPIWDARRQAIHDKLAKTSVVRG